MSELQLKPKERESGRSKDSPQASPLVSSLSKHLCQTLDPSLI